MDSSIKGLDCGADAYVGKPFDPFYLKAVINNLLENRKRMQWIVQNLTSESLPRGEAREAILNEQDRQFLENLHTLLDKHLDDEAFGITSLDELQQLVCPSQVVDGTNTAELSYHLSHEHGYATAADGQIHCERSVLQGGSFFAGQLLAQLQAAVWCSAQ